MKTKLLYSSLAVLALFLSGTSFCRAYPDRPDAARMQYEMYYFPIRVLSMFTAIIWDVPTGSFQDAIKGSIGGTRMVARNLGNEDGIYELVAGGATGGPVGFVGGSIYGVFHGFAYGAAHGFAGNPSPTPGSYSLLFQSKQYVVPYGDSY